MSISIFTEKLRNNRTFLMGLATIMVVIHHITWKNTSGLLSYAYMFIRHLGAAGVDIFLFLSGFGLFYSFCKCKSIKEFYKKRFLRIVPIYLIIAIPWYFYVDVVNSNKDWLLYIGDLSTLSFLYHGDRGHWYIFGILVLYLLYPLLHKSIITNKKLSVLCFLSVYTIIVIILVTFNISFFDRINVFLMRVPSFYIGAFVGGSEDKRSISSTKLFALMAIMVLVSMVIEGLLCIKGLHYSALARIFYTPLAISICFFGAWLNAENIINSFITWIGGFSLEMYLVHMKCTALLTAFLGNSHLALANMFSIIISVVVSVLVSNISKKIISTKG